MKIEINAEQIDQLVRDTIVHAGIGKAIEKAVTNVFQQGYNNPIETALNAYILQVVRQLLETDFKDQVDAAVKAALAAKMQEQIIEKLAEATITKIARAADRDY